MRKIIKRRETQAISGVPSFDAARLIAHGNISA
jgi:hypothetical protein